MYAYKITMSAGPTPGKIFDLTENEISVGRDIHADIVINVPEISRRHARLWRGSGGYTLEDLGSTNGTYVNGQRLSSPYTLRSGDTIMFGEAVTLVFEGGGIDPDATVVSASSQGETIAGGEPVGQPASHSATMIAHDPATPFPAPVYDHVQVPQQPPAFSGQVPAGPVDFGDDFSAEETKSRTWLWAGLGCLVVMLCGCVAGAILFDMMDMYCQPPFDSLFNFLYTCP